MTVKDDILALKSAEESLFEKEKRYIQALPTTPATKDADATLAKPASESVAVTAKITDNSYTYRVDTWTRKTEKDLHQGFVVIAEKDLGDGVFETLRYGEVE